MTKEEFIKQYCELSGVAWGKLSKHEIALPCACENPDCQGWAMVPNNASSIKSHMELYGANAE